MMRFALITASLCAFSWISVSVSEFHTVEVQLGEEVTLLCSNFSSFPSHMWWFKLDSRPNISCISSMFSSDSNAFVCDGLQEGKFNMTSNTTTLLLKIKQVDFSDSGLYFCGVYMNSKSVIVSATYLKVQEACDGITELICVVLGVVFIVLIIVNVFLVVKIRKLHTVHKEGQNPQQSENLGSDALNYAALSFHPRATGSSPSENQLESHVVYAATR